MERLIRRRRETPELGWGAWRRLEAGDRAVFAHRADWEGSTVVAVHNLAGRPAEAVLDLGEEGVLVDLFGTAEPELEDGRVALALEPYDGRWYRLRRPGRRVAP
jgi:maltose alpha-D-glucosyltransferase/alpha-amylase